MPRKLRLYLTDVHILKVLLLIPEHQIKQSELIKMLGTCQETVYRRLKVLKQKGLVKIVPALSQCQMHTKLIMITKRALELKELILEIKLSDIRPGRIYFDIDTTKASKKSSRDAIEDEEGWGGY